jgi:multiple sugar transport system permease protein
MTHERPYREPWSPQQACEALIEAAGTQFDPEVTQLFVEQVRREPRIVRDDVSAAVLDALPLEAGELVAANVDGATLYSRIRYVVLPLAFPAIITVGVLAFREAWNEFNLVLALTSTPGSRTLPYELFLMTQTTGFQDNPGQAAFAIMTIIPFIFVYLRLERYIVSGLTSGALK